MGLRQCSGPPAKTRGVFAPVRRRTGAAGVPGRRLGSVHSVIGRIVICDVEPVVECGQRPAKAVAGETFEVSATVFREGHEGLGAGVVLARARRPALPAGSRCAKPSPAPTAMWPRSHPRRRGPVAVPGRGLGRPDRPLAPRRRHQGAARPGCGADAGRGSGAVRPRGEVGAAAARAPVGAGGGRGRGWATRRSPPWDRLAAADDAEILAILHAAPLRELVTRSAPYPLVVHRLRALYGAWYEFFPRSEGVQIDPMGRRRAGGRDAAHRHAPAGARSRGWASTWSTCRRSTPSAPRPARAATTRCGRARATRARPGRSAHRTAATTRSTPSWARSPTSTRSSPPRANWAWRWRSTWRCRPRRITHGSPRTRTGSPTGPTARSPTRRTRPRSTRTSTRSTSTATRQGCTREVLRIVRLWMSHGVRIFRVDNPHTKPLPFWERLLAEVDRTDPDVIFLAEAFTRPPMMARPRQDRLPPVLYLLHLAKHRR